MIEEGQFNFLILKDKMENILRLSGNFFDIGLKYSLSINQ